MCFFKQTCSSRFAYVDFDSDSVTVHSPISRIVHLCHQLDPFSCNPCHTSHDHFACVSARTSHLMTPFSSYRLPSPLLALLAAAVSAARKETYLWFYWHDMMMAEAVVTNAASATSFCAIYAMDDPLTEGLDLSTSRLVGRAQDVTKI